GRRGVKCVGKYIGNTAPPGEMYGKTLSLPDEALGQWYSLLLGTPVPGDVSARDAQDAVARALVARFHGASAAQDAAEEFSRVFVTRELPSEIEEAAVGG